MSPANIKKLILQNYILLFFFFKKKILFQETYLLSL